MLIVNERWQATQRFVDLAPALVRFCSVVREPALETWARRRLWQIYSGQFPNPTKAAQQLERLSVIDPLDGEVARAHEQSLRQAGNWHGLLKLLSSESRHLEGAPLAQACEEEAELWSKQGRRDEAFAAQVRALQAWPTAERAKKLIELTSAAHQATTRELVERAAQVAASDYRTELEALAKALGAAPEKGASDPLSIARMNAAVKNTPEEKLAVFAATAEKLEGEARAHAYAEMLSIDPESMPALRGLSDVYRKNEKWNELADVLRLLPDVADSRELAKLCEQRLGRPNEAAEIDARLANQGDQEAAQALERPRCRRRADTGGAGSARGVVRSARQGSARGRALGAGDGRRRRQRR